MRRRAPVAFLLAVLWWSSAVEAVPRYSARYRQNCTLCHQNPTGGGLRSLYASQFLVPTEMTLRPFPPEKIARIRPDLSPSVTVGTDLRSIHVWASEDRPESNFFQMQGDLYVSLAADERFSANLDVDQVGSVEAYALGWILPWSGYVKVGRFTPVFGWKFEDHNMFTREALWFDQPYNTDAGLEIGFYPRHFALWGAVLNGEPGSNRLWDRNRDLAVVGGGLVHARIEDFGFGIGGSIWRNAAEPVGSGSGRRTAGGPFGYAAWRRLAWLWEVDASRLTVPNQSSKTLLVTAHEVSFQVQPGLDVVGTYNWQDPDLDYVTGTRSRYGIGVEMLPVPFVEVQAAVSFYRNDRGTEVTDPDFTRSEVLFHLYY